MIGFEELLAVAYKRERLQSRRLAKGASLPEHDALIRTLTKAAGAGTLRELVEARRAEQAREAEATRRRQARRANRQTPDRREPSHADGAWIGWFDGSALPNPGRIGIGGLLRGPRGESFEISATAGHGDSSAAEYLALIALLETALREGAREVAIHGDSRVVIDDMLAPESAGIRSMTRHRLRSRALIEAIGSVQLRWLPRERNARADELSRQALAASLA
jgi:ribonuclease HI